MTATRCLALTCRGASPLAAGFALVLVLCPGVRAATPTDTLRQLVTEANLILTDPGTEDGPMARLSAVRNLVDEALDSRGAAELAAGRHWLARTPAEQDEFVQLFADLLVRSYVGWLASKASLDGGVRIRYLGESVDGELVTVRTAVATKNAGEMLVDYRMVERGGRWMIRDLVLDGVSITANYRAQLDRVLQGSSYPDLVAQMRALTAGTPQIATAAAHVSATVPLLPPTNAEPPVVVPAELPVAAPAEPPVVAPADLSVVAPAQPPVATPAEPAVAAPAEPPVVAPAEPPVVAPAKPPVAPVANGPIRDQRTSRRSYWVQVGTFRDVDKAVRLAARLTERNLVLTSAPASIQGGHRAALLLRVRVGPFSDAAEAVSKLLELQAKGHNPFLLAERE